MYLICLNSLRQFESWESPLDKLFNTLLHSSRETLILSFLKAVRVVNSSITGLQIAEKYQLYIHYTHVWWDKSFK